MKTRQVTVIGGGVAGLATALLSARHGHRVTLVERDSLDVGLQDDAPHRERPGIPHYLQPHAFIPRGRSELRRHLPDVYDTLLAAGAVEVDLRHKLPGTPEPADEELQYLAVRRPVIEWALRRAVAAEPGIERRDGVRARELALEGGRATGVHTDAGTLAADVVVDAHGRRDGRAGGFVASPALTSPCGVVYYSRYYRCRPGFVPPDGPWFLSPRGDLGYFGFATFPGDNATFATVLSVPPGVPEWRALADPVAYEAAVTAIPALHAWADPSGTDPITDVLPMAGLQNRLLTDPTTTPGCLPVGDAYCHTDPMLAFGLAFGFLHAAAAAAAIADHADPGDVGTAYRAATADEAHQRYAFATELDEQRQRAWLGLGADIRHHDGDYALFSIAAAGAVARVDPTVFRVFARRIGGLDLPAVLDGDLPLRREIERRFAELTATPPPPAGPTRERMSHLLAAAVGAVTEG